MNWITGIQRAINYIEDHITDKIDYEEVGKCAYSSSFHFQRVFSVICGYTVGEYVRNRRLSLAGEELANPKSKIIDVALKYGYSTPESFSRAFSKFHGVMPNQVKSGATLKSFSRLSVKLTLSGGSIMNYRIEKKEAFDVILKKKRFEKQEEMTTEKIADFWKECTQDGTIEKICGHISKNNIFKNCILGISFDDNSEYDFPYGIGAHCDEGAEEEGFEVVTIPENTFVVFQCVGVMPEAFKKVYKYICTEFFPASEYQPCGIEIEAYPSADVKNPQYTCEIWIAVTKK